MNTVTIIGIVCLSVGCVSMIFRQSIADKLMDWFDSIRRWRTEQVRQFGESLVEQSDKIYIVEGVSGMWHYHLSRHEGGPSICGNGRVMSTSMSPSLWMVWKPDHIPASYCKKCREARERGEI